MNKIYITVAVLLLTTILSCRKTNEEPDGTPQGSGEVLGIKSNPSAAPEGKPLLPSEIDKMISRAMDEQKEFSWQQAELRYIWSAIHYSDHTVAVGYKPLDVDDITPIIHQVNINSP